MTITGIAFGQGGPAYGATPASNPYASLSPSSSRPASSAAPYPVTSAPPVVTEWPAQDVQLAAALHDNNSNVLPTSASWIVPAGEQPAYVDAHVYYEGDAYPGQRLLGAPPSELWSWQVLPDGLIYRSYQAGVHESRTALHWIGEIDDGRHLWDATLGGRAGLVRFGNSDPLRPVGWQLDIEGAAMVRLNIDEYRDLDTADFRFGIPLTYGIDNWQFKFGYYHLSSHLGDEFALRNPGTLATRVNYVRDSLLLGASYYPIPLMRLYSEAAYATNADGGAEPWEFHFGTELSRPGPTGPRGTPFLAVNVHLREEHDFGGDLTTQAGWLWRGLSGQTMRVGAHYFNGKSSQFQTFDESEEQLGLGLWYDF